MSAKKRRARGSGSVYLKSKVYWISYYGPDGKRHAESAESTRKGDAERLLQRRVGARDNNLPVIPKAEHLTFPKAAQAVIDDFAVNGKRSLAVIQRRIEKHLTPYFGARRLVGITAADVTAFIAHRQAEGIVRHGERVADVSNAEINRELQALKRIFSLAIKGGRIATRPHIPLLREAPARSGFFERAQLTTLLGHLPPVLRQVIAFAAITGWRIPSEVLTLEWRNVDFAAGEVRLAAGTTKNLEPRVFPMTTALRTLLKRRDAERKRLQRKGTVTPLVFFRVTTHRGKGPYTAKPVVAFTKAWRVACAAAGCPGRIPHDLRRTAVRNLVRAGIPERVAMQMTGHKTRSVFERYNIVSGGDLRDAAKRLDSSDALPAVSAF